MLVNQSVPDTVINVLDQTKDKRPSDAVIYGIDGAHADIRLNNSVAIIRHVEVIGSVDSVNIGDTVQIIWKSDGRPVIMLVGAGGISSTSGATVVPDNATIENSSFGLRVKKGGISREHLSFIISDEIDVVDSLTRAGWSVDPETGVISQAGISISPTNGLSIGSGNDIVRITNAGSPDDPASPEDDTEYRLWIGHTYPYAAGFAVTKYGDLVARQGSIGGWNITSTELYSDAGNAVIHAGARPYIGLGASKYLGDGFWAGLDTDYVYKVSIGSASAGRLAYDGATLTLDNLDFNMYYGTLWTLEIQADGDFTIGSDIDTVAGTSMKIFTNDQSWNAEAFTAGDILVGDHDGAHMLWDQSSGQLQFRDGGVTGKPTEVYIDTDGSLVAGDGDVTLNSSGLRLQASPDVTSHIVWQDVGTNYGWLYTYTSGTTPNRSGWLKLSAYAESGGTGFGTVSLQSYDAGINRTGILNISGSETLDYVAQTVTTDNATNMVMFRRTLGSGTYAEDGFGFNLGFILDDDTSTQQWAGVIETKWIDVSASAGAMIFYYPSTAIEFLRMGYTGTQYELAINEQGGNYDFRVEGTSVDTIFSDASENIVQIQNWLELPELATGDLPTTGEPATGWGALFVKPDGKVHFRNDSGTEYDLTEVGAGNGGGADILEVQVFM